jgi:hypothetical protein
MKKEILFWVIAFALTAFLAIYQRVTGPTYPIKGSFTLENQVVKYDLPRSSDGNEHTIIKIAISDTAVTGKVSWKRFKVEEEYSVVEMKHSNGQLAAELPKQPAGGKVQYSVILKKGDEEVSIPEGTEFIFRFRDAVPIWVLIPHIVIIFLAMLFSTRAGLEYFSSQPKLKGYTWWTIVMLIFGGFVFGPLMQYYAFGTFWTGIPFGFDLTDNKTLVVMVTWLFVLYRLNKSNNPKRLVLIGAIIMFVVYMIPHSVMGTELDYKKLDQNKATSTQLPVQN